MMKAIKKGAIVIILLLSLLTSCFRDDAKTATGEYRIDSVKIYQNTPVWELAQAVKSQNTRKISSIAKDSPDILNYQDPVYGTTLLFWAVGMEKYKSAEALLKAGADPDIISTYEGGTALYRAAGYSFIDTQAKKDPKYVKLLLEYGADPNIGYVGGHNSQITEINGIPVVDATEIGTTPLMQSIGCGIEKTKALVEAGADIDTKTEKTEMTAASTALLSGVMSDARETAHYLIVEKKADITQPYYLSGKYNIAQQNSNDQFFPVDLLRDWISELDSEEYQLKMEIVEEFARQGEDYWVTEIPQKRLEQIQKLYPDTWEEYILKGINRNEEQVILSYMHMSGWAIESGAPIVMLLKSAR